jgi:hypothetical protein
MTTEMVEKKSKLWKEAENKIKEIWRVLSGKNLVKFVLTVRLYGGDLSEPKTISVEGDRSENGGWKTSFPRKKNSGPFQSTEVLQESLASIEKSVHRYIVENALDEEWKELKLTLEHALKSGYSVEDLAYRSGMGFRAIAGYGYGAHFYAPIIAAACAIKGGEALKKNDLDHATYYVECGVYWSGSETFISNPKARFTERARKGGISKALALEPVKDKVAELLKTLRPDGWQTTSQAIFAVSDELTMRHSKFVEDCGLTCENLPKNIKKWVKAEPERYLHRIEKKAS